MADNSVVSLSRDANLTPVSDKKGHEIAICNPEWRGYNPTGSGTHTGRSRFWLSSIGESLLKKRHKEYR